MKCRGVKIWSKATGCFSVFNSDCRHQHNRGKHEGISVAFETEDAGLNLVKRREEICCRVKDFRYECSAGESEIASFEDHRDKETSKDDCTIDGTIELAISAGEGRVAHRPSESDVIDGAEIRSLITCAGQLKNMIKNLQRLCERR